MDSIQFGNFIVERRKELGISQGDLASFLNVSVPTVSKWENGSRLPDLTLIGKLARILQVDLESLLKCESQLNNNIDIENEFDISAFSKYFAYLRKINNYSLKDLEDLLDVRYQTISKWENEESLPNIFKIKECADLFKVPLSEIYYGKKFNDNNEVITTNTSSKHNKIWMYVVVIISIIALLISLITILATNNNDNNSSTSSNNTSLVNSESNVVYNNSTSNITTSKEEELNVYLKDKEVIYDGKEHSIYLEGIIPEDVIVEYQNNNKINAGIYEVKAIVKKDREIVKELKANLIIHKAPLNVKFNNKTFSYDGEVHYLEIEGTLPNGVSVEYINNLHSKVGDYEVLAVFNDTTGNYDVEENLKAIMSIVKDGKYHDVYFCYEDGKVDSLIIPNGSTIPNFPKVDKKDGYSAKWIIEGTDTEVNESYVVTSDLIIVTDYKPNKYKVTYKYNDLILFEREATYSLSYTFENYELSGEEKLLYWSYKDNKFTPNTTINFYYLEDIVLEAHIGIPSNEYNIQVNENDSVVFLGFNNSDLLKDTLEEITIPEFVYVDGASYRVTNIGSSAFEGFKALKKVTIPEGVKTIGSKAFKDCIHLKEINLPSTLTIIGENSFENCYSLKIVNIPSIDVWLNMRFWAYHNIFNYGAGLYVNNELIKEVTIPSDDLEIKSYIFENYTYLEKVVMHDNITYIGACAFKGCNNLKEINISKSIVRILDSAFNGCTSIKEIDLNVSNIKSIGNFAFYNLSSLEKFNINSLNDYLLNVDYGCKEANPLSNGCDLYINNERIVNLVIPEDTVQINDRLFSGCTSIESIEYSSSLVYIGYESFYNMPNLKEVVIKNHIVSINFWAFGFCENATLYVEREKSYSKYEDRWNERTKTYYKGEWEYVDEKPQII